MSFYPDPLWRKRSTAENFSGGLFRANSLIAGWFLTRSKPSLFFDQVISNCLFFLNCMGVSP